MTSKAISDIIAERRRQVEREGFTPNHDDEHMFGEIALAAAAYALDAASSGREAHLIIERGNKRARGGWISLPHVVWPWDLSWWKPGARRANLVKAGALIVAEIERIDRATAKTVLTAVQGAD